MYEVLSLVLFLYTIIGVAQLALMLLSVAYVGVVFISAFTIA